MPPPEPVPHLVPFACTACKARLRLPASYVGKAILCPKCNAPQRVIPADTPMEPMDTTRALRADEVPERPVGAVSGAAPAVRTPVRTPMPTDMGPGSVHSIEPVAPFPGPGDGRDFDPLTAPARKSDLDAALTGVSGRRSTNTSEAVTMPLANLTMAVGAPVARPLATPPPRALVIALVIVSGVGVGLVIALVACVLALSEARAQAHAAEERATAARQAAEEADRRMVAMEARLDALIQQLAAPR